MTAATIPVFAEGLFVEFWESAAYAFVGSSRGNIKAHSAGTILIQHQAAGHEVEG